MFKSDLSHKIEILVSQQQEMCEAGGILPDSPAHPCPKQTRRNY